MTEQDNPRAQVVLDCPELAPTIEFFCEKLDFRILMIFPADSPRVAELAGYGIEIRLERNETADTTRLRLVCERPENIANGQFFLSAPNGTSIELVAEQEEIMLPALESSFVISRADNDTDWIRGRAGMQYRDLIPGRLGGRYIASHIRILDAGPVPDYVHYHKVQFQMIYCHKGWVKVVYQDQGKPFVMQKGDCVLQPPQIRHRVLECSAGLEVVEIGCPADHITCVDNDLVLPTDTVNPQRDFSGQQFVRHQAKDAKWQPWRFKNYEARDLGIGSATAGLAGAKVFRPVAAIGSSSILNQSELMLWFVLQGELSILFDARDPHSLRVGDAVVIPTGMECAITKASDDLEVLQITSHESN